ncbi:MAG TPA: LLM class flavin-dependent oxidoreductase [Candidatus Limnocylindria bacterium]|nr:LLM class flavin-dependent oxidoreductase [Candidatus Limnocylindria bacterium]
MAGPERRQEVEPLGRGPLFGVFVTPTAADHALIIEQVRAAERAGLDLVGIQDHPYQRRFLDTFALIADLAARTERIRFFPDVANLPLRGPTMIAKAAASIDVMSGGRFELGIGAGAFWDAVAGMGGPRRGAGESISALEEAMRIIRAVLDGERVVRGPGPHYPVPGYPPGPPPAHRVELWVGAYRPRGLDLIARLGDGWVPSLGYVGPDAFREAATRLDDAAARAGRDPRSIRRIYNLSGLITDGAVGDDPLVGPVELWVERLASWTVDLGVDAFIFSPPDTGTDAIARFADEVVPAVKEAVSRR